MVIDALRYYLPKNIFKNITLILLLTAAAAIVGYGREAANLIFSHDTDLKNTFMEEGSMQNGSEDYRTCMLDRLVP